MSAVTFTTDHVIKGISNCSNTKAFGPDKLSIFHLKNLGPRAIEYLTALFNDSVTSCRILAIWKSSVVIPIPKPGKNSSIRTSYRPISLLCPTAKVMETLILTTVNTHLLPASDQHGFRTGRSTTSSLRIITGSHKMSSIDHIHIETKMRDHLNLLSAQYLVQCLDTENVCHHITKIDLPPREMKETIFTRHYQTVLPLLANRKDTLQALHTSFVNTAIGNMKDNRVLNSRPPSINDEETLLQRRQRTTLSQLRSGHCKLLNSYKKRLKQSDSSRCADCGMDPHDVPHLFDCVAHPNDLSPVNLWDKPIETIRELSFLDPGNLN